MTGPDSDRLLFRRRHRLTQSTEFQAAYLEGCRKSSGPITVYVRPNGLTDHRLGLSVGRRVGGAIRRNQVKKLLREAFRHEQKGFAPGIGDGSVDVVIQVRPHTGMGLVEYRGLLTTLVRRAVTALADRGAGDAAV